jgi:hypothetical protein
MLSEIRGLEVSISDTFCSMSLEIINVSFWTRGSVVVKALRYKQEGRGFDTS